MSTTPPPPHPPPNSHFVRKVKLRLAYRLAFVITVQNPKSKIPKIGQKSLDFGFWIGEFWILDFGPKIQNPKSPRSKIQNPKSPKSKIQNPQNPKSKIRNPPRSKIQNPQNPQNPKSSAKIQNLGRWGASQKDLLHNDPKSKIPKIQNLGILDFGFWIRGILDFGDFGFWIWGILDFGFGGFWILDLGDFGFWILGILDFGFCCFWCFWGGPGDVPLGNLVTVLGGQRLESPPGPPFRDSAKPTLSDIVGARKQIELQKPGAQEVKTIFYTFLHDF